MFQKIILSILIVHFFHLQAATKRNTQVKEAMIQDLNVVKYHMDIKYAPKEWKEQYFGWNIEKAYQDAVEAIDQETHNTSRDYQKTLKKFLGSAKDYHVGTRFYSSEWAMFPITVKRAENRYYISEIFDVTTPFSSSDLAPIIPKSISEEDSFIVIDAEKCFPRTNCKFEQKKSQHPFVEKLKIGDEVTAINGTPISSVVEALIDQEFGGDRSETGYALATDTLFYHRGEFGEDVPRGAFELTVLHQGSDTPSTYQFAWQHFPEWVMNKSAPLKNSYDTKPSSLIRRYCKKEFAVQYSREIREMRLKLKRKATKADVEGVASESDHRIKGFLPELGEVIWENSKQHQFYAYLYQNPRGRKIGYLYLPTFGYEFDAEEIAKEIGEVLQFFNHESAALIIDISDNPGGNLLFTYAVLSFLTDKPMEVPSQKEILIQKNVFESALMLDLFGETLQENFEEPNWNYLTNLDGYHVDADDFQRMVNYFVQVINAWEVGKTLTDPLYIYGIERIKPHPKVRFKKPILLIINELGFSCSDFFAAVLQDNRRATLFGNTTAGAGGYVLNYPHTSRFGVESYNLTGSIALRKDGVTPIENLGVCPDIFCKLTRNDMLYRYVDYRNAIHTAIENLLESSPF